MRLVNTRLVTAALAGAVTVAFTQLATAQGAAGTTGYPSPSVNVEQQAAQNRPQYGSDNQSSQNMPYSQQSQQYGSDNQPAQGDRDARNEHERHEGASGGQTGDHDRHARGDDDHHDRHGRRGGGDDDNSGRSGGN